MLLIILITSIVLIIPFSKNLIPLGSVLLLTSILSTFLTSFFSHSWFSFILFLVFVSGLLVLFSYIIAISSNIFFTNSSSTTNFNLVIPIICTISIIIFYFVLNPIKNVTIWEQEVNNIFNDSNILIYWLIGFILLVSLIIAVIICFNSANPLRSYL